MYFSAECGLAIKCRPSTLPCVCDIVGLEIFETNYTGTFALCSQKAIHLLPWKHGENLGRLEVGYGKSGMLENKLFCLHLQQLAKHYKLD